MAATPLTVIQMDTPFLVPAANGADFVFTAGDVANGNSFPCTGKEIILVQNSDGATPYTVTINSVADAQGRTGNIGPYTLQAGEFARFSPGLTGSKGWIQSDGTILINVSNAAVKLAVLRLP